MTRDTPRNIFAGLLKREFIILPNGKTLLDIPGGNLLYALAGFLFWDKEPSPGIVARVGEDYPRQWLNQFEKYGADTRGVKILPEALDLRYFAAYSSRSVYVSEDPVAQFARLGLSFPKALLGYRPSSSEIDSRTNLLPTSLRKEDIFPIYLDATAIHLCAIDYLTHSLLPALLRQAGFTTVTLDPSPGYMNPTYWGDVPALIPGLTAFLPSEDDLRFLFQGHSDDLWEMAEALAAYGCEIIVIKCGERGQLLYDAAGRNRWEISSYPSRVVNPVGVGDAFSGGFLAGYRRTYDPIEAVLWGNISASLVIEGMGPFYILDTLPGLAEMRLETVRQSVRKV
jgi:sugar/nucleoside kinase (ribokinase family)